MKISPKLTTDLIIGNSRDVILNGDLGCTAEITRGKVSSWKQLGAYVVAIAGAYDMLGLNHIRGLVQARIAGAAYMLGTTNNISKLSDLALSDELKLLVSLDTNGAVEENKSFNQDGGGSVKPILDWSTRATMLTSPALRGRRLVDFITKHGPNSCNVCQPESCLHSSKTYSVASTDADLIVVKSHNNETFARHPKSLFHVIDESKGAFSDTLLGEQISTSSIIKRIRSERSYNHEEE
jgi:hypothetical protein